ncbi:hypothetical protein ACTMU2_17990 [Cupriavidus basilensis]
MRALIGARTANEEIAQANSSVQQAKQRAIEHGKSAELFSNAVKPLLSLVPAGSIVEAMVGAFTDATLAVDEASRLSDEHRAAFEQAQQQWRRSQRLFESVRAIATSEGFVRSDLELAEVLRRNTLEEALEDYERIENGIIQHKAVITDELAKMEEDFERAVTELAQLVGEALSLLRRATETLKLPDHVPRVAGRTVLTMQKGIFGMSKEARRERLGPFMTQLAADGNIPESGAALATPCSDGACWQQAWSQATQGRRDGRRAVRASREVVEVRRGEHFDGHPAVLRHRSASIRTEGSVPRCRWWCSHP